MPDSITVIDAHVHVHADADVALLLDSAAANFAAVAARAGARLWRGVLMLAEMRGVHWFGQVNTGTPVGKWRSERLPDDPMALRFTSEGRELFVVAGRQVVTSEGVEVLTLATDQVIDDGLDLPEVLRRGTEAGALLVLPWGVGKWLGKRGQLVGTVLGEAPAANQQKLLAGDNGGRPVFWPRPAQFAATSAKCGVLVSGSDPLPLPGDERRVGSFGFWIPQALSTERPTQFLRRVLQGSPQDAHAFGSLQGPLRFFRNQLGLRMAGKVGVRPPRIAAAVDPDAPETPDIETSSAGYARRFSGPAGRYLLAVQTRAVRAALAGLPPGKALDVGGGHGQLVPLLQELGWQVTVHGTSAECETNLRALHGRTQCGFLLGPIEKIPVADHSFDLVIAVRLLPHVERWPALLGEMARITRRTVVVDYPNKSGLNALTPVLFGMKKSLEGNTRTYISFSRAELQPRLAQHGLTIVRQVKQFFLPMVVHRIGKGAAPLRAVEWLCRTFGLTAMAGSPVILRADRNDQRKDDRNDERNPA